MDQQPHRADDEEQHRRQAVDEEGDLDLEVAGADPLVQADVIGVAAEDDAAKTIMLKIQPRPTSPVGTIHDR